MLPPSQTLGPLRTESGPMRYYTMECQLLFVRGTILYLSSINLTAPQSVSLLEMWASLECCGYGTWDKHLPQHLVTYYSSMCPQMLTIYCVQTGRKVGLFLSLLSPMRKTSGILRNVQPSSPSKFPSQVYVQCSPSCLDNLESWEFCSWFPAHTQLTHTDFYHQPQKQEQVQDTQPELSFLTRVSGWPRTQLAHDGEGTEGELS